MSENHKIFLAANAARWRVFEDELRATEALFERRVAEAQTAYQDVFIQAKVDCDLKCREIRTRLDNEQFAALLAFLQPEGESK